MSIGVVLSLIFLVLKLIGVIAWPWLWVVAPVLAELAFALLLVLVAWVAMRVSR